MRNLIRFFKGNSSFLIFLFSFSWLFILRNELVSSRTFENFSFHADAPFWYFFKAVFIFVLVAFIKKKINTNSNLKTTLFKKHVLFLGVGLVCYVLYSNVLSLSIAVIFGTFSRNFGTLYQVVFTNFSIVLDFVILGSFSLAYLYFKENQQQQKQVNEYEISKARNEITQLRAQLNPHFLFNNLNVLDHLIEEDTAKASSFLNHFSELYRYSLFSADKELVSLHDELTFSEGYFELMKVKYNGYYYLTIEEKVRALEIILPPFCIQVLVENAITHNRGTTENPIHINIETVENGIKIRNNKVSFKNKRKGNGVALNNISKQFNLFSKESISIEENDEYFEVVLPFINLK